MAIKVREIMNPEVYTARPTEKAKVVLKDLKSLGVGGAPVVDETARPVGVISLPDLAELDERTLVSDRMTAPPLLIDREASIHEAALLIGESGYHRLVVVDRDRAVGVVSSIDVIRALIGLPAQHPWTFPHYDLRTGLVWMDETLLDFAHVESAPEGPGIFVVIQGGVGKPERILWGESSDGVRGRLLEYLNRPESAPMGATKWPPAGSLRFRAASIPDERDRERALEDVLSARA